MHNATPRAEHAANRVVHLDILHREHGRRHHGSAPSVRGIAARWQAAAPPANSSNGGAMLRQIVSTSGQRGWKAQPVGGCSSDGGAPPIENSRVVGLSILESEASRPRVYGWRGAANNSSTAARSTT